MTDKNLFQFANDNWGDYKAPITDVSKNNNGISLVEDDFEVYNFDKICEFLFSKENKPTSADGIQFFKNSIHLIEFKSGFKQKITKDKFDIEKGKCEKSNEVCSDYWNLFWENQDRKIKELISSIRLKAIESYLILEKHLFPNCLPFETQSTIPIVFTVIVEADGIDGIEDTLADLSNVESVTDNSLNSIKQSLKRLMNKKDSEGRTYLYDSIEVLTVNDFENWIKTIA